MDGFKLGVGQAAPDQKRNLCSVGVQESFELPQHVDDFMGRRWIEGGIAQGAAPPADPVLRSAELARKLFTTPHALHQLGMNFAQQPQREWQLGQPLQPMVHGPNAVDDFFHVFGRLVSQCTGFKGQHVFKRALRAFDLGGKNGFVAHIHDHKKSGLGSIDANASGRPMLRSASDSRVCSSPLYTRSGSGGRGAGMKAF